ncbi:unnamed protein product [Rotaria socialis]|uniref:[histone H3]-lysine(4) N-trimethyltransferase n=10 Tax=Rotaria socialis TaxID=392032 RepID=A0A818T1W9_9BILA|nr:unnamed protein product [Rotaria socialis]CAF3680580.1 unnamed protein product [Rotaria socialis]CAF3752133.1 unnamed protein product [Rotaria socialis]
MLDVPSSSSSSSLIKPTIEPINRSISQTPMNEKRRNYRFYAGDPAIHPAEKRLYANGDFEGTPLHVSGGTDPRDVTRFDRPYYDLPVPKFKLDRSWVGVIPAKEVTFRNLNDNITKTFLTDICKRFGDIEDCRIYYDRQTKKHLGLGTVIFKATRAARECVGALNMTTKMGSVISVSLETSGQERTKQYATIIRAQEQEKAAQEKALAASAAASPPPSSSTDSNLNNKQTEKSHQSSQLSINHKITNHISQTSNSYSNQNNYRTTKSSTYKRNNQRSNGTYVKSYQHPSTSTRYDSRGHHSVNDNADQFSFDPYGSFGNNSNNYKSSSRRSRHRSHNQRSYSQQRRRRRKTSSSATSSSASRSSSSASSSSSSSSSSTSRSDSRSSSSTTRSSYSSSSSPHRKPPIDSRKINSKQPNDDEDHRPSLDERIAALFQQQQQQQTTIPTSIPTKPHHRPILLPNAPHPSMFSYPPPRLPAPLTNVVGSHHHHQQSYGVVNNFNFFGNSFPPASFLNSTGGTNWQDMFKQPPPSTTTTTTTTTTNNQSYSSTSNGLQPHSNDSIDERVRKTNDLTTAVSNIVKGELVEILRKDLAKKLIETLVYKSIETWYDNEERKDKIRKIKSAENPIHEPTPITEQSTQLHHSISNQSLERTPDETPSPVIVPPQNSSAAPSTNLSTYFEHMKDSIGSSIRSQMPKIPSFKKRTIPDEKPTVPEKRTKPIEKKEPKQKPRKIPQKRLSSSSSSDSNITPDNDDSQSHDSVPMPHEDTSTSDAKATIKTSIEHPTLEEEEGEIKDDDNEKEEEHQHHNNSNQIESEPQPPPAIPEPPPAPSLPPPPSPTKKAPNKNVAKQNKKPGAPKKRKMDQIKIEPIQDDDIYNSTLAKRKKIATNLNQAATNSDIQPIQTFNLLDSLPEQIRSPPKLYNPFAYIEFEHNYAIMAKQPVPVAKRLTIDGLNDMGIQAPMMLQQTPKFPPRQHDEEMRIMYELDHGVDEEDMSYLKQSFQKLCDEGHSCTTKTRWVDHPPSRDSPFVKQQPQKHRTGCARTEGYYKIVKVEKIPRLKTSDGSQSLSMLPPAILDTNRTTGAQMSRELRSEHRRNLLALGDVEFADHFKFSQLKLRKKRLRYAKSSIHSWGLFACEPIAMEDMVIEYVGETIRQSIGDLREKKYELEGINSNYMFRVDSDTIVDATKCGNLARFINHSCDPNCYAKIIPVESQKKIVIYSKRDIRLGEEITYDYKFPLEEQKIPCCCGGPTCRGSLN